MSPKMKNPLARSLGAIAALAAAAFLASCQMLPGGEREAPASVDVVMAPPAAAAKAPAPPAASDSAPKTYTGTGVFINQKPTGAQPPQGPEEASLNFEGLDIREVAKVILGDYLKESYTVHPGVTGTVTFRTIRPIGRKDLLATLEMLLRQNNAAVVREEGVYKILPVASVRGSISPQLGATTLPIPPGFNVLVVPLKFVGAAEMVKLLEPFAADNTVRADTIRNLVILAGHQREMRHLLDTIDMFDVDWLAGYSVGLFPVKSADVKTLVADIDRIFGAAGQSPLGGIVRVIPIERMNALLIVTTQPKYLEMARNWIDRLDTLGGTSGGTRFFVYYVKNGKAENLAQLIGDLFSSRRSGPSAPSLAPGSRPAEIRSPTAPGSPTTPAAGTATSAAPASATFQIPGASGTTSSEVRVIADKDTNSLLILSTPSDYDIIENALRKLDVVPRQVLVEVLLAEVTLTDNLSLGIDWFLRGRNNSNTTGYINFNGSLPRSPAAVGAAGTIPNPTGVIGDPGAFTLISRLGSGDIRAILTAEGGDGRTKVLASPQLMVLDNQKAQIKVGDKISVQTQSQSGVTTSTGVLNSFQYLETGILLSVTPRINSGGQVTLEVNQEVSSPGPRTNASDNPDIASRSVQTTVVVASGESIVLGGLIRENIVRSTFGVPLLSKIPILGAAFGTQTLSKTRTELVLVITPRIVSDARQAQEASEELRRKLPALHDMIPKFKPAETNGTPPGDTQPK